MCLVGSVASLVGTPLEMAAFRSGFDAKYSRASAFGFLCPQPWFLRWSEHILSGKTPAFFYVDRQLVTKKEVSNKKRSWPCGLVAGLLCHRAEFGSQRGHEFFLFLLI